MAPKAEAFIKSCLLDTFVDPKFAQNVEHCAKMAVQTERRRAARRGRGAKFDECFRKSKQTDAPPDAPEMQNTSKGRDRATEGQPPSNRRATAEQSPSQQV